MHIKELYPNTKLNINITGITNNSKAVKPGYIFVAIKGQKFNGNNFINEAIEKGASLIVCDKRKLSSKFIYNKNTKLEFIRLLQIFYNYKHNIYTVGITGTDGKTTTSTLLNSIFNIYSKSSYIGSNGVNYLKKHFKTKNTTPGPDVLYPAINILNKHEINNLILEVSSEGILDNRINGFLFDGAIFTNLSHEHLNTHKNMDSYFICKTKLFKSLTKSSLLVINYDDSYSSRIRFYTEAKIITYGFNGGDFMVKSYNLNLDGSTFSVYYKGKNIGEFKTKLFGKYNIYNCLATIAYSYELGIPVDIIRKGILAVDYVDGRFIKYKKNNLNFIIDYAHTPNALKSLLTNLKLCHKGRIILITGAQGEKDYTKRHIMGFVATKLADITIFTSEDPKNENLFSIFKDLTKDLKDNEYYLTLSRFDAIKLAINISKKDVLIVICGKGNETHEIILGYQFNHSDIELIKKALNYKSNNSMLYL